MSTELENEFFSHFNVSDREKELLNKFKEFQQFISRTKSLPFFLCSIKDCDGLKKCVDDGFDISTIIGGESLLSIAIANNDDAMASFLFNNKFTFESETGYLKHLLLAIEKRHKNLFDFLLKQHQKFSLSEESIKKIIIKSLWDVDFISKIVEENLHISVNGASLISDLISNFVKKEALEFLVGKNLIETEKCNYLYGSFINRFSASDTIELLTVLSPHCSTIEGLPFAFMNSEYADVVKFLLLDKKYSSYNWIANFFEYNESSPVNKTSLSEILCVRHNMSARRSMYAKQDEQEESGSCAAQHSERIH